MLTIPTMTAPSQKPESLGAKLSRLRNEGGFSYSAVARWIGRSTNAVRDIEAGRTKEPSVTIVRKLAEAYHVTIDWLTDESQGWPPPPSEDTRVSDIVRPAIANQGLAGELTDEERELLAGFRKLPPKQQDRIVGYVIGLAASGSEAGAQAAAELFSAGQQAHRAAQEPPGKPRRRAGGRNPA